MFLEFLIKTVLRKKQKDPNKLVAKKPDEDFIPYVCHYDENSILTKNGELLQIIRVTGFSNSSVISEMISLRDAVRDTIMAKVEKTNVAFWFTTIRRKKNITPKGEFGDFFSKNFNEFWVKENDWDDQYVNELYVTIITEGLDTSIINMKSFLRSFSYLTTKSLHKNFISESHQKLSKLTSDILEDLKDYGGKLLGIVNWEGVLYSEPMRFFGKVINLHEERYPLAANDISNELASHKMAFGDREMQVVGAKNKNFAAIFSLKEYTEVSTQALDQVLQLPMEFIITQSFDFAFLKKDLDPYEFQNYILQVSGDEDFRQISGIKDFVESRHNESTDYGKLQTTIAVISHDHENLEKDIKEVVGQFSELGLVIVREDIFAQHCFWSQLPANFRYLCRQKLFNTSKIAGFAALHSFPTGRIVGNHWGHAVSVFKTILNTPYFFNFHQGDSGHSLFFGGEYHQRVQIANFLLTQARKFNNKIFYFDFGNSSKIFTKVLGGDYYQLDAENNSLKINPFAIEDKRGAKEFFSEFFVSLIYFFDDPLDDEEIEKIPEVVDRFVATELKDFFSAIEIFNNPETKKIYEKLKVWNDKDLSYVFASQDEINWAKNIITFDLTQAIENKALIVPIVTYLLYKIRKLLDEKNPSIIVLNEFLEYIDNPILNQIFDEFLKYAQSKNCVVIMSNSDVDEELIDKEFFDVVEKNCSTFLFFPNKEPQEYYKNIFKLNDEEVEIISQMESDRGHFLLKNCNDSVILSLSDVEMREYSKIFFADEMSLLAMEEVVNDAGGLEAEVSTWFLQLIDVLKEIENDQNAQERERLRQERVEQLRRFANNEE